MSTKHVRCAGDLVRFRAGLKVSCVCGHCADLDGWDVARAIGQMPFSTLARRLRCSGCGRKGGRIEVMTAPPPR